MNEACLADLIGLGAGGDAEAVPAEGQFPDPDRDQLGATEGAGEADQDQRPSRPAVWAGCRGAGNALQGLAQFGITPVEGRAQQVRRDDGREPACQGDAGALSGGLGEMVGDQGRGRDHALRLAPRLPGAQMAAVGAPGLGESTWRA
jgi:hypothetical protein